MHIYSTIKGFNVLKILLSNRLKILSAEKRQFKDNLKQHLAKILF